MPLPLENELDSDRLISTAATMSPSRRHGLNEYCAARRRKTPLYWRHDSRSPVRARRVEDQ